MEPRFPVFDIFSIPLLLLLGQGFLFVLLIGYRFLLKRQVSDLFLGLLLLIFCYERIHYAVGFMAWYDSFTNTKINYFLFPMTLAYGPLLYFYVRSITAASFKFSRKYGLHFMPFVSYILYRLFLFAFDASQPGFDDTQNGILMSSLEFGIINPIMIMISSFHLLLYFAFTVQLFWFYRLKIKEFYSNTYRLELNWIRNFLIIFGVLFLYNVFQNIIDSFIVDLHWTQKWWYHFLSSGAILYFGIKGYFTKTAKLQDLAFNFLPFETKMSPSQNEHDFSQEMLKIQAFMEFERPYLDPSLNLKELSNRLSVSTAQLSEIINHGFGVNFNDFVNGYRVEEVKKSLRENKQSSLSLVGIAYDSGFNSKATFNRVFKKLAGISPSEFIANL